MRSLVLIAHNIRSTHNIGSLLRTCDGLGVKMLICSGYTPYPKLPDDTRLPHISEKVTASIAKTALGAERTVPIVLCNDLPDTLQQLKHEGYRLLALEQTPNSILLPDYIPHQKTAVLLGEEVAGISLDHLKYMDDVVEIPMYGHKESSNVSVAAGIALFHLRTAKH